MKDEGENRGKRKVGEGGYRGENRKELKKDREGEVALQSMKKENEVRKKWTYGRQGMVMCPSEHETPAPVAS